VLLGDGFDARPFRLPWPPGTVIFLVAPPESHERAEALLAGWEGGAPRVERGCLLRRVSLHLGAALAAAGEGEASSASAATAAAAGGAAAGSSSAVAASSPLSSLGSSGSSPTPSPAAAAAAANPPQQQQQQQQQQLPTVVMSQLERAGFRQDRLSLWALQGLHNQALPRAALMELLAEITNCASFHSLVVGDLPLTGSRADAENALADVGLLGAAYAHEGEDVGGGFGRLGVGAAAAAALGVVEGAGGEERRSRWLFAAQQMRVSLAQMGIYEQHVEAAEDEDFDGHFS